MNPKKLEAMLKESLLRGAQSMISFQAPKENLEWLILVEALMRERAAGLAQWLAPIVLDPDESWVCDQCGNLNVIGQSCPACQTPKGD